MTFPALFGTAERIIFFAYEDACITQEGNSPNSEQIARAMVRLNDIINFWCTQGLKLWTLTDQSVTLVASQQSYTFMPAGSVNITKPMRILQGYVEIDDSDGTKRPIYPISWDEWMRLSNNTTANTGPISQFFVDKLFDRLTVKVYLTPDSTEAANTMHLLIQQQITNFTGLTETMMFPQEWFLGLRWALADELSSGQPLEIVQRCMQKAEMYKTALENWDVEDVSTQFVPDQRMAMYNQGRFR
jgi:hypothetical protein